MLVGLRARRRASESLEEYFLAGRTLPGWQAGMSMAATQFAADTPLLVTGLIATAGIFSLWRLWIYAVAFLLLGFVLAGSWRRSGVLTDAELAELRYASAPAAALRGIKAFYFGTVFNVAVLAMVLFAAKEIAEPFLPWNEWLPASVFQPFRHVVEQLGVPFARAIPGAADLWTRSANNVLSIAAIVTTTTLYSTTGGLRSVVRTDVAQLILMLSGTALYAAFVVRAAGGFDALPERLLALSGTGALHGMTPGELLAFTPDRAHTGSAALLLVLGLQWLVQTNADGTGYLAQRTMACRSDTDAKHAALVFVGAQVVLRSLLWLPLCVGLLVLFPPDPALSGSTLVADREATFVRGMRELLPAGALGIMLTAMLAALASTLDTHLNWGASYWANDLYARFLCRGWLRREPSPRSLVWVARLSNLGLLGLALALIPYLGSIASAWQTTLLLGAGMGVILVLRWLWWRLNAWGEIGCLAASAILAPVLLAWAPEREALRLLLMAAGATLTGVTLSLVTAPEPVDRLRLFYARARPPGFWAPVAAAIGEDPAAPRRRLLRGLGAVALLSFATFSLLTAVGSLLVSSPPPVFLPDRIAWSVVLLAAAALTGAFGWRLGHGEDGGVAANPPPR